MAMSKPSSERGGTVPTIVAGAIQRMGFRETESMLVSQLDRSDLPLTEKGGLFYWLSQRKLEMAATSGDPFEPLNWLGGYLGKSGYPGPNTTRQAVALAARSDFQAAFDWLE